MKLAFNALQAAIYQRLTSDSTLMSKVNGVYDQAEDENGKPVKPPYVTIGQDTSVHDGTKTFESEDITTTIHVWSQQPGKREAKDIASAVAQALTSSPLDLGGEFSVRFARLEYVEVLDDPDGITKHAVMRFRFRVNQGGA